MILVPDKNLFFVLVSIFSKKVGLLFPLLGALMLWGCDRSHSSSAEDRPEERDGFIFISASGKSAVLGTSVENAKVNERPEMVVKFDYDFFLGKHEVSCGEYSSLMKGASCKKDSLPVSDVSYYDAVLFANAMSKREHLDTAYSYMAASVDESGRCYGLEGLTFHPEVLAYRLPTEAEWVYAASLDWNPENSWTAGDSIDAPRKVCSKGSGPLCDMEGNLSEWVNDWLGFFRDTAIVNFVGAPDGGSLGERIIKGGSYRNAPEFVNRYSRGDVYTVTSSTHAPYVGFRLALGSIPNATWLSADGSTQGSRVQPMASSATVQRMTGSYRSKLAFRNDVTGNLSYIDYSNNVLSVVEIKDSLTVYHPEISPDGKWVAFCSGLEGLEGMSKLYVRELDGNGKAIRLDVESAAIPRWKVLDNGDTVVVYVSDAGDNKDETKFLKKSTWQVLFSKGKFGTPQKVLDGAFHGGVDGDFAVTGSKLLRVHHGGKDSVWYNSEQACNVSLSKSGDRKTLFLDFGGKTGQKFVGQKYGSHERILVVDSTGALVESFAAPAGFAFDHSEWVSENLIVSTLTNVNGAHAKIVLVDLNNSRLVELAEGEELWHPSLWVREDKIDVSPDLDLDSAARYYSEDQAVHCLSYKMRLFWKLKDSLEIVGLGNSHMNGAFAARMLKNALNFAAIPCDMHCNRYLFENYVLNHCPKIRYLIVGVDFDAWVDRDGVQIQVNQGSSLGFRYDVNHDFWKGGVPKGFVETSQYTTLENEEYMKSYAYHKGLLATYVNKGWVDENGKAEITERDWDVDSETPEENFQELLDLVKVAKDKGIRVIGVIFPVSPYYRETDQFSRHGMLRSTAEKYIERLKSLEKQEENFILFDENKMGEHDYDNSMAFDYDHLNLIGAELFTQRLDSLLRTLE